MDVSKKLKLFETALNKLPELPEVRNDASVQKWTNQVELQCSLLTGLEAGTLWADSTEADSFSSALQQAATKNEKTDPVRKLDPLLKIMFVAALNVRVSDVIHDLGLDPTVSPLFAWSKIQEELLGPKDARINQANADLEHLRPENGRLAVFVSKYVSLHERLHRLYDDKLQPGLHEVVCMRRAIIAVLPGESRYLPDIMKSTTIDGLRRTCEEYDTVFRVRRESEPSPSSPSATANSASASAAPAADRTCFYCGSSKHILIRKCKLCLSFVDRMFEQPEEDFKAWQALCRVVRSRAPATALSPSSNTARTKLKKKN
eukprot:TRINITY_DN8826_c0_g1_i1.p1 TRINITY_DN8826_c0_g1~~TRINITY_DN8826_c0_g1_i1.p1  ORF type:complete len:317 (+),score=17.10 TRINITY_DN8826_c0_g1_i1:141-1091(+)